MSLQIVSGENSRDFWDGINEIDGMSTGDEIHNVLYSIGCKMQELESEIDRLNKKLKGDTLFSNTEYRVIRINEGDQPETIKLTGIAELLNDR